jgi:hypothetical protein
MLWVPLALLVKGQLTTTSSLLLLLLLLLLNH